MAHSHEVDTKLATDDIQWKIDHACRIDILSFKVLVLVLSCLAILASLSRLHFRLRQDRRLLIDDWLLLFATVCLIAETGCLYHFIPMLYLIDAATTKSSVFEWVYADQRRVKKLLDVGPAWVDAYFTLAWIAVFSVKFSFLALFYRMVRNVKKSLTIFYWVTFVATAGAGIVVILESFILCPHFGSDAAQCFMTQNYTFSLSTGIICQVLDIATDILIMSIPILLLRMSQLRCVHKLRISMVLCLSCVCIIFSAGRLAGGIHKNVKGVLQFGLIWISFMLHCEAAVAVMAGSVPALDALYRSHQKRRTICGTSNDIHDCEEGKHRISRIMGAMQFSKKSIEKPLPTLPKRTASKLRHSLPVLSLPPIRGMRRHSSVLDRHRNHNRSKHSSQSSIATPSEAYHSSLRRDHQPQNSNQIHVTYECTVLSEEASLHDFPDFSEVGRREWIWERESDEPEEGAANEFPQPPGKQRDVLGDVDPALLGRITSGMMA